jgi:hypothetical protein
MESHLRVLMQKHELTQKRTPEVQDLLLKSLGIPETIKPLHMLHPGVRLGVQEVPSSNLGSPTKFLIHLAGFLTVPSSQIRATSASLWRALRGPQQRIKHFLLLAGLPLNISEGVWIGHI